METTKPAPVIVDPQGKPARAKACPTCGAGPEHRKPMMTFGGGENKFHCVNCGGDW